MYIFTVFTFLSLFMLRVKGSSDKLKIFEPKTFPLICFGFAELFIKLEMLITSAKKFLFNADSGTSNIYFAFTVTDPG